MAGEIEVDTGTLRAQATEVARVADAVDYARDAAGSMNLAGGAFGLMCSFLVPTAVAVTALAGQTMAETARMLRREAEALRDMANDFEQAEERAGEELRALTADLEAI